MATPYPARDDWRLLQNRFYRLQHGFAMQWPTTSLARHPLALAPAGGPIAVHLQAHAADAAAGTDRDIIGLYRGNGQPLGRFSLPMASAPLHAFAWIAADHLLCVLRDGECRLYALSGAMFAYHLWPPAPGRRVVHAAFWPRGVIVVTSDHHVLSASFEGPYAPSAAAPTSELDLDSGDSGGGSVIAGLSAADAALTALPDYVTFDREEIDGFTDPEAVFQERRWRVERLADTALLPPGANGGGSGGASAHASPSSAHASPPRLPTALDVVPPAVSPTGHVHAVVADARGGLHVLNARRGRVYHPNAPDTVDVHALAVSPSGQFLAVYQTDRASGAGRLQVVRATDGAAVLMAFDPQTAAVPRQLAWCGADAVALLWPDGLVVVGPHGDGLTFAVPGLARCATDVDGLRVISAAAAAFVARVPDAVVDVCGVGSTHPGALLLDAYVQFADADAASTSMAPAASHGPAAVDSADAGAAAATNTIRHLAQADLVQAVMSCIEAAGHETDPDAQKQLLKAAAFGKLFIKASFLADAADAPATATATEARARDAAVIACSNRFARMNQVLRVLNTLRAPHVGYAVTLSQYMARGGAADVVRRLVHAGQYLAAWRIMDWMHLDAMSGFVLLHWVQQAVKRSYENDAGGRRALVAHLQRQLQSRDRAGAGAAGADVMARMAAAAYASANPQLALELVRATPLGYQLAAPVMLLLDLHEPQLALLTALASGNTDLVQTVLRAVAQSLVQVKSAGERQRLVDLLKDVPLAAMHYVAMLSPTADAAPSAHTLEAPSAVTPTDAQGTVRDQLLDFFKKLDLPLEQGLLLLRDLPTASAIDAGDSALAGSQAYVEARMRVVMAARLAFKAVPRTPGPGSHGLAALHRAADAELRASSIERSLLKLQEQYVREVGETTLLTGVAVPDRAPAAAPVMGSSACDLVVACWRAARPKLAAEVAKACKMDEFQQFWCHVRALISLRDIKALDRLVNGSDYRSSLPGITECLMAAGFLDDASRYLRAATNTPSSQPSVAVLQEALRAAKRAATAAPPTAANR
ncbi:hypothetical protein CXG81DRAFT_23628 [Caulochytrium protostelioides]|uniref:Vps16 N-terminal domain-containing protein n=1 Tax=Caulochytrium protostelioides TaxID=1555241 RepID=A0A4P9XE66_9FUNG|nr:hypothetical protein CXG81DRAFT_23628 [Caulochytrium protostelioides]|eukprot:RKP03792.1 hypothetical protein CXG81DRAFT_23628 [Caulochytrium protostelioides]